MAEYVGSSLYMTFAGTVLSGDYRSFNTNETIDQVDATAGSDTSKSFVVTTRDATASASLVDQSAGTALWNSLVPGASGTLIWAPEGTAAGKPKYTALAHVTSRGRETAYDGLVVLSFDFQFDATITTAVY
jgi:hypothetical protein